MCGHALLSKKTVVISYRWLVILCDFLVMVHSIVVIYHANPMKIIAKYIRNLITKIVYNVIVNGAER